MSSRPSPIGFNTRAKLEATRSGIFRDVDRIRAAVEPDRSKATQRALRSEYQIARGRLGRGVHGAVYAATRRADGAPVVFKSLVDEASDDEVRDEEYEVLLSAYVSARMRRNPFFMRVLEVGVDRSGRGPGGGKLRRFVVAERLLGADPLYRTPDAAEAGAAALCLAAALRLAHERMGFRHRDLHRNNVMLRPTPPWVHWVCFRFANGSTVTAPAPRAGLPCVIDYGRAHVSEMGDLYDDYDVVFDDDGGRDWCYNTDLRRWLIGASLHEGAGPAWEGLLLLVEGLAQEAMSEHGRRGVPAERRAGIYRELLRRSVRALAEFLAGRCGVREPGPEAVPSTLFVGFRPGSAADAAAGALVDGTAVGAEAAARGNPEERAGALAALRDGRVAARLLRLPAGADGVRAEATFRGVAAALLRGEGPAPGAAEAYAAAAWINRAGIPNARAVADEGALRGGGDGDGARPLVACDVDEERSVPPSGSVLFRRARYFYDEGRDRASYVALRPGGGFVPGGPGGAYTEAVPWEECSEWDPEAPEGRGAAPPTVEVVLPAAKRPASPPASAGGGADARRRI